jgi:hypothetical protein
MNRQLRTSDHLGALLFGVSRESLIHKVPPSCEPQCLVHIIDTVLRAIAHSAGFYTLQNLS